MKDFYPVMAETIKSSIGMSLIQPISTINVYRNYGKCDLRADLPLESFAIRVANMTGPLVNDV